jgi:hypothetical protein
MTTITKKDLEEKLSLMCFKLETKLQQDPYSADTRKYLERCRDLNFWYIRLYKEDYMATWHKVQNENLYQKI